MKTHRSDIETNKRKVRCPNSSFLGFSSSTLRYGDLFMYRETYTDGTSSRRLAKCHGQVRPKAGGPWLILAQAAFRGLQCTGERWVDPDDVVETIPAERANKHILAFFTDEEQNIY